MSNEARNLVESYQPYNRTNPPDSDILWTLNEASRVARHRLLTPVIHRHRVRIKPASIDFLGTLNPGGNVHRLFLALLSDSEWNYLEPEFSSLVAFEVPGHTTSIDPISLDALEDIYNLISGEMLPRFARCFSYSK